MKEHNYPKRKSKYTTDLLTQKIGHCISIREALTILELSPDGGHKELRKKIKSVLINNGNYKGQAHKKNQGNLRIPDDEFFTYRKIRSVYLKNTLFSRGLKERRCENCDGVTWLDNPIPLEVHHKDGDKYNNHLENLEILCPNCHAFTDTYRGKNIKRHGSRTGIDNRFKT